MNKSELRDALMQQLWRMNKLDLMVGLREFIEGELAALNYLRGCDEPVTPSQISENLRVSRARAANILRSLRGKGYVAMEISSDDRRKMNVSLTDAGRRYHDEKYGYVVKYFDLYVDVLGEEDIAELTRLLKKTADSKVLLREDGTSQKEKNV